MGELSFSSGDWAFRDVVSSLGEVRGECCTCKNRGGIKVGLKGIVVLRRRVADGQTVVVPR